MRTPSISVQRVAMLCLAAISCSACAAAQQHFLGSEPLPNAGPSPAPTPLPDAPAAAAPNAPGPLPASPPLALPSNFRIAPAATRSDLPGKLSYYLASTVSVRNVAEAVAVGGIPNITSAPMQPTAPAIVDQASSMAYQNAMTAYGDQMDAWRRVNDATLRYHAARLEVGLATAETRQFFSNLALPLALHQQARYLPAPVDSTFGERMWNAVSSIAVTRSDTGFLVPNYSKLGGTVAAAFLGKVLYASTFKAPELDSGRFVTRYIGYSLLGDLATNTAHELVRAAVEPDMTLYGLHGSARDDSYYPLSLGGKLVYWGRSTYGIRNFAEAAFMAGVPNIPDQPVEPQPGRIVTPQDALAYDSAYEAWGTAELSWKRDLETQLRYREHAFLGGLSESETQMFLQNFALPVAFDMDPRYLPLGPGHSAGARVGHALRGLVMTHMDSGASVVNLPVLGGTVGAAFAARELYYPQLGTTSLESNAVLGKTISLNLAADAIGNLYTEFFGRHSY